MKRNTLQYRCFFICFHEFTPTKTTRSPRDELFAKSDFHESIRLTAEVLYLRNSESCTPSRSVYLARGASFSVISFFGLFSASRLAFPWFFYSTGCIFSRHVVLVVERPVAFNLLEIFVCFLDFRENLPPGSNAGFHAIFWLYQFYFQRILRWRFPASLWR